MNKLHCPAKKNGFHLFFGGGLCTWGGGGGVGVGVENVIQRSKYFCRGLVIKMRQFFIGLLSKNKNYWVP